MFRGLVGILVIVGLLACPVWCSLGLCVSSDSATAAQASDATCARACCHRPVPASGSPSDSPSERPSSPQENTPCGGGHQCICGGAVFEQNGVEVANPFVDGFQLSLSVDDTCGADFFSRCISLAEDHCRSVLSGRMVCCLYERFLC